MWIEAVKYVSEHWNHLRKLLATIPEKPSSAAVKALAKIKDRATIVRAGFIAGTVFLAQQLTSSRVQILPHAKPEITSSLIDLSKTGNEVAKYLLTTWQSLRDRNKGLQK